MNPKKFRLNLNSLWGSDKSSPQSDIQLTDPSTNLETNTENTCSVFNAFFAGVATKIQHDIPTLSATESSKLKQISIAENITPPHFPFRFDDVSTDLLKEIISGIDNYKSSGLPEITSKLFKISIKILMTIFRHILNLSMRMGIFPDDWKNSVITPLH